MNEVPFPVLRLDERSMPRPLKGQGHVVLGGNEGAAWSNLVGASQIARARHGGDVISRGAALGRQQVIVAVHLVDERSLYHAMLGTHHYAVDWPDELLLLGRILLKQG